MPATAQREAVADRDVWPVSIPNATQFSSDDGNLFTSLTLISQIKGMPQVMRTLSATRVDHNHGQRRSPGDWSLIYLAYVIGREPNVEPWHRAMQERPEVWRACGFSSIPAYQTVWQRFAELEQFEAVFEKAAHLLIQVARRKNPLIGAWMYMDGTECETHAKEHHACGPDDACPTKGQRRGPKRNRLRADEACALREQDKITDATGMERPRKHVPGIPIPAEGTREITERGVRVVRGGHWWFTRDLDAATRAYGATKWWDGYMHHRAIDLVTHAPIVVRVTPANVNEHDEFPRLYERACEATGIEATAVIADMGFSVSSVYDLLTERGVTLVTPTRETSKGPVADGRTPSANPRCDMHGIPTCKHCGLPCDFVGFSKESGKARVWFRCPLPSRVKCRRVQSMVCSKATRRLIPIWRTAPVYNVLRAQIGNLEHVHEDWRTRYKSGGKELHDRQRRIGIACQQLRASAALLIEWCWVLMRQGWIGPRRTERATPVPLSDNGRHARLMARRKKLSLLGGGYPSPKPPPGALLPA